MCELKGYPNPRSTCVNLKSGWATSWLLLGWATSWLLLGWATSPGSPQAGLRDPPHGGVYRGCSISGRPRQAFCIELHSAKECVWHYVPLRLFFSLRSFSSIISFVICFYVKLFTGLHFPLEVLSNPYLFYCFLLLSFVACALTPNFKLGI